MTYGSMVPEPPEQTFVPRVFGFRVHASAPSGAFARGQGQQHEQRLQERRRLRRPTPASGAGGAASALSCGGASSVNGPRVAALEAAAAAVAAAVVPATTAVGKLPPVASAVAGEGSGSGGGGASGAGRASGGGEEEVEGGSVVVRIKVGEADWRKGGQGLDARGKEAAAGIAGSTTGVDNSCRREVNGENGRAGGGEGGAAGGGGGAGAGACRGRAPAGNGHTARYVVFVDACAFVFSLTFFLFSYLLCLLCGLRVFVAARDVVRSAVECSAKNVVLPWRVARQ